MEIREIRNAFGLYAVDVKCSTMLPSEVWTTLRLHSSFDQVRQDMARTTRLHAWNAARNAAKSATPIDAMTFSPTWRVVSTIEKWLSFPVACINAFSAESYKFDKSTHRLIPVSVQWHWNKYLAGDGVDLRLSRPERVMTELLAGWNIVLKQMSGLTLSAEGDYQHITASQIINLVVRASICHYWSISRKNDQTQSELMDTTLRQVQDACNTWLNYVRSYALRWNDWDEKSSFDNASPVGEILLAQAAIYGTMASYYSGYEMFTGYRLFDPRQNLYMNHVNKVADSHQVPHIGYLTEYVGPVFWYETRYQGTFWARNPHGQEPQIRDITVHDTVDEFISYRDTTIRDSLKWVKHHDMLEPYFIRVSKRDWIRYAQCFHPSLARIEGIQRALQVTPAFMLTGPTSSSYFNPDEIRDRIINNDECEEIIVCIQNAF